MKSPTQFAREGYHRLLRVVRPQHPFSQLMRAERAIEGCRWGLAFDLSSQVLNQQEELPEAFLLRAIARLHLDDYGGARRDLHQFLARSDNPPPIAYFWRGWLYANQGEPSLALCDFERVLASQPDDANLLYWMTRVHWMRGDWEQMAAYLDRLLTLRPASAEVMELEAHLLKHRGELEAAERLYGQALALGGDETTLRFYRAKLRRESGALADAGHDIDYVLAQAPTLIPARLECVNLALDRGEYQQALNHAQQVLVLDERNLEAHIGEALALLGLGHNHRARCRLTWLRRHFAPHPLVEKLYGDLLMEEEESETAAASYQLAIQLDPEDATLPLKLAGAWVEAGHFEEARGLIDRLLEAAPTTVAALSVRADLHRLSNDPAAMRADLDIILRLDPHNAWALCYRGYHRHWCGDVVGAWQDFDAALSHEQSEAWMWAFRGNFHRQHGRYNAACHDFRHAITLDPEDPWTRRQWAALLSDEGQIERAATILDRLLSDFPNDGYARIARLEIQLLAHHWQAAHANCLALIEQAHELAWLAHAVAAALSHGAEQVVHLRAAERATIRPTFWGYSAALLETHRLIIHLLHGREAQALAALHDAECQLRPGERLWPGLRPLLNHLGAEGVIAHLGRSDSLVTARLETIR